MPEVGLQSSQALLFDELLLGGELRAGRQVILENHPILNAVPKLKAKSRGTECKGLRRCLRSQVAELVLAQEETLCKCPAGKSSSPSHGACPLSFHPVSPCPQMTVGEGRHYLNLCVCICVVEGKLPQGAAAAAVACTPSAAGASAGAGAVCPGVVPVGGHGGGIAGGGSVDARGGTAGSGHLGKGSTPGAHT
eukprot:scaffold283728_cov18-Tisochrysis_lutea.AAC.2